MEMEIKITGCPIEDSNTLNVYANSLQMYESIVEARDILGDLIDSYKFHDDVIEELQYVQDILFVQGVE